MRLVLIGQMNLLFTYYKAFSTNNLYSEGTLPSYNDYSPVSVGL